MNPFMLEPRTDEHPPKGYVSVHVPGMRRVWIDRDIAVQLHGLLSINKLDEAVLAAKYKAPEAKHYQTWLRDVRAFKEVTRAGVAHGAGNAARQRRGEIPRRLGRTARRTREGGEQHPSGHAVKARPVERPGRAARDVHKAVTATGRGRRFF